MNNYMDIQMCSDIGMQLMLFFFIFLIVYCDDWYNGI